MADEGDSKSLVLITRVGSTPTTGIRSSLESNDSGLLFFFQKTLHRNRLGTLYCHEGDWSWIYFFNGQCADAAGTALWQWLGQQRRWHAARAHSGGSGQELHRPGEGL